MKVNVTVKSAFVHGNKPYTEGDSAEFTNAEAHDMEKSGLVEIHGDVADESTGTKMADSDENKMAEAPENKSRKSKQSEA